LIKKITGIFNRLGASVSHRRPHSFDRQEHDPIAEGTTKKSMVLIEANRIVINGVSNDCSYTGDLRRFKASPDPIRQQICSQTFALVPSINGQSTDE